MDENDGVWVKYLNRLHALNVHLADNVGSGSKSCAHSPVDIDEESSSTTQRFCDFGSHSGGCLELMHWGDVLWDNVVMTGWLHMILTAS